MCGHGLTKCICQAEGDERSISTYTHFLLFFYCQRSVVTQSGYFFDSKRV